MKLINTLFIGVFFSIISTPLIFLISNIEAKKIEVAENRRLASFPRLNNNIKKFNQDLELFINDNIPLRTIAISFYHYLWGWKLYSPISPYIRGKENHIFRKNDIIKQIGLNPYPKFSYNEIINGMNFIAKQHNAKFIFLLSPDKESVMHDYLPNWVVKFKTHHHSYSLREILVRQLDKKNLIFIDLYNDMINHNELLFNYRYDTYHWNGNGLLLALYKLNDFINIPQLEFNKHVKLKQYTYNVFPYFGPYSIEIVNRLEHFGNTSNIQYIDYDNINRWTGTDYTKFKYGDNNSMALFSDSSLKNKCIFNNKTIPSKANMTPYIYLFEEYIQPFNKNYISYIFFKKVITDINATYVIYQITERTLNERGFPNDPIFRILGRYALKKNENFIFPEYLTNKPNNKTKNIEKQISKNDFINIKKSLKTDKNGEIYISFRYKAPKNTVATLEYSFDKSFKNTKKLTAKVGGGYDAVSFHIKAKPNKVVYVRLNPGKVKGTYKFLEIPELREKK